MPALVRFIPSEDAEYIRKSISRSILPSADYCFAPEWWTHRPIYLKFHPKTKELIIHDGACARVYADGELIYAYEKFNQFKSGGKKFGGDTYGAITATDDSVFFGGFAYADVSLSDSNLAFTNKYSHIHKIGSDGRTVDLVWYEGPGTTSQWRGEVVDMVYSPKDNAIYFSRGDGQINASDLWKLDLNTMQVSKVTNTGINLLKMELFDTKIYAGGVDPTTYQGVIVIYDISSGSATTVTSVTGKWIGNTPVELSGQIVQYLNRLVVFGKGAFIEIEPKYNVYTQFPFFKFNGSQREAGRRSQKVYIGGTPIIAVNPFDYQDEPKLSAGFLIRWETPTPQIIMPTTYVSGLETDGKYLYIASSPQNHSYRSNPVNYTPGRGGVFAIPVSEVFKKPLAPVVITDGIGDWATDNYLLGVPITGFTRKILKVKAPTSFTLDIVVYYTWPGKDEPEEFTVNLSAGWNTIDLSSYSGIVAVAPTANTSGITILKLILEP